MSEQAEEIQRADTGGGILRVVWRNKLWWMLSLALLIVLIGIVYVLGHLSSADSEMYPTSSKDISCYSRLS